MGSGSSIFEIGPKKISDNEQRLLFLLASVAPLFIIHLMKDRFNDSYVKKVLASIILLVVFYIFLHLSILNYIGCDVAKTLTVIMPNIFKASFAMAFWGIMAFELLMSIKNINTIAVYGSVLVWQFFVVFIVLYPMSYKDNLCPDV